MNKNALIFVAGHNGLVGSAIVRKLEDVGYTNIVTKNRSELDLMDQMQVRKFFKTQRPQYVINAAAKVGGIKANMTFPAEFSYENLQIQNNLIWSAKENNITKLLFISSACIHSFNKTGSCLNSICFV